MSPSIGRCIRRLVECRICYVCKDCSEQPDSAENRGLRRQLHPHQAFGHPLHHEREKTGEGLEILTIPELRRHQVNVDESSEC
jgi:hypothetical protein